MRILIATHGEMAAGIRSAAQIIVGNVEQIDVITAYVNDVDFKEELEKYFAQYQKEELLVCTDLFGGSVNQSIIQKLKEKQFTLITGINLPLMLEILMAAAHDLLTLEKVRELVEGSRHQLMIVNDELQANIEDDFD